MLHFIWFEMIKDDADYLNDKDETFVWNVSEIFNLLVQNSETWSKVFNVKAMAYPNHEKIISNLNQDFMDLHGISAADINKAVYQKYSEKA